MWRGTATVTVHALPEPFVCEVSSSVSQLHLFQ